MKRFAIAIAVVATAPLYAGVRIQMENTDLATNKTSTQVIMMDNTRMRVDADANTSTMFLTDGGRNRLIILDKARNTYQEIDEATMKQMGQMAAGASSGASAQMAAQMDAAMKNMTPEQRKMMEQVMKGKMPQAAAPAAPAPKTVYTAKGSGSVNGFSCTKYDGMQGAQKVAEVCAASPSQIKIAPGDYQVFEKMNQFTAGMQNAMKNFSAQSGVTDSGIDGFPVQTVSFRDGQPASRMELKSLTNASFSDADFSLGTASKMEMPAMGGRGR